VKAFVDTNILVYAYDRGAGAKHDRAAELVEALWQDGNGLVSTQVLQEFYVNVRRKAKRPISPDEARSLIHDYLAWEPIVNDGALILDAVDAEVRYQLSFWDALIVAAAEKSAADVILSEDFSDGQRFGSVEIRNPFGEL
jgi:predicted nucleic acid-binding protein